MFSSDLKAVRLAELKQQGPKHNTNAQRLCCVCGMLHGPGGCVAFRHQGEGYVYMRNEMDALKREVRRMKAGLVKFKKRTTNG